MRCYCCNKNLSDKEATQKSAITGDYLDMCDGCLKDTGISVVESNLSTNEVYSDYADDIYDEEWEE